MIKIIFYGIPGFFSTCFEGLVEKGYEVLAVVTQPDRAVGRKDLQDDTCQEAVSGISCQLYQMRKSRVLRKWQS